MKLLLILLLAVVMMHARSFQPTLYHWHQRAGGGRATLFVAGNAVQWVVIKISCLGIRNDARTVFYGLQVS